MVPTETVYGIVARPDEVGVAKLFAVKHRPADKSLQVLVPDVSWLEKLARPTADARALAAAFWPGPLTLVVEASDAAPAPVRSDSTIGLRQPAHPIVHDLLARTGPLAASSANLSGDPTPSTIDEIRAVFGNDVGVYLDGGDIAGIASTVVSVTDDAVNILRHGAISDDDVKSALGGTGE